MKLFTIAIILLALSIPGFSQSTTGETQADYKQYSNIVQKGVQQALASRIKQLETNTASEEEKKEARERLEGDANQAQFVLRTLIERFETVDQKTASDIYRRAIQLFLGGDLKKSLGILDDSQIDGLQVAPVQKGELYYLKGTLHIVRMEWDKAVPYFAKAHQLSPDEVDFAEGHALLLGVDGQYDGMVNIYQELLLSDNASFDKSRILLNLLTRCGALDLKYPVVDAYLNTIKDEAGKARVADELLEYTRLFIRLGAPYEGEPLLTRCQSIYESLAKQNPDKYLPELAFVLDEFGYHQVRQGQFAKAGELLPRALEIYEKLEARKPDVYQKKLDRTLHHLAYMHAESEEYSKARDFKLRMVKRYEARKKEDPAKYDIYIAKTQVYLGNLESQMKNFLGSKDYYLQAIKTFESYITDKDKQQLPEVAAALSRLGTLHYDFNKFTEAVDYYSRSKKIYESLGEQGTNEYVPDVAYCLYDMAIAYHDDNKFDLAIDHFSRGLELIETLAKKDPASYKHSVLAFVKKMAYVYIEQGKLDEGQKNLLRVLTLYRELENDEPGRYQFDIASTLKGLGHINFERDQFAEARDYFQKALEIFEQVAEQNDDAYYSAYVSASNIFLGKIEHKLKQYPQAQARFTRALEILEPLSKEVPEEFMSDFTHTQLDMALLLRDMNLPAEAKTYFLKAKGNYEFLIKHNPECFQPFLDEARKGLEELAGEESE